MFQNQNYIPAEARDAVSRRTFLGRTAAGMGTIALGSLLGRDLVAQDGDAKLASSVGGALPALHHMPKAKRVIFLCMAGGASHLETLDYKPKLAEMHGKGMPESITKGQPIAQLQGRKLTCLGPQIKFERYGKSGQLLSSALPHIGSVADEICVVRSMVTEQINHDPAHTFMNTGTSISGRPSMGSWLWYGLGNEADDLPGFVVMVSVGGAQDQPIASRQWQAGFVPSRYQGVYLRSRGEPVLYLKNPAGVDRGKQGDVISAVEKLNRRFGRRVADPEIATRITQYEMAFKMQRSVPDLADFSKESQSTLEMYGVKEPDGSFAANCLLARRMAERGVRFIQIYHRGWDHHGGVGGGVRRTASYVDKPSAALVQDLEQRGLLDDTLVVWGGEFGRTPMAQGNGRDHHIKGFSWWMAGGGIQGGISYGGTDDFGYNAVDNVCHMHDFHATMLHCLGVDHKRLTYRFQGRDFRLTDVHGNVMHEILA